MTLAIGRKCPERHRVRPTVEVASPTDHARGQSRAGKPANLPPGEYRDVSLFANATPAAASAGACEVALGSGLAFRVYEFDPVPAKFLRLVCVGNSRNDWNSLVEVQLDSVATSRGNAGGSGPAVIPFHPLSRQKCPGWRPGHALGRPRHERMAPIRACARRRRATHRPGVGPGRQPECPLQGASIQRWSCNGIP